MHTMRKNLKKSTGCESGYSLIQICIGLLVIGLLGAPVMTLWSLREKEKRYTETSANIDGAISQIQGFVKRNGYYPCPASMTADRDDTTPTPGFEYGEPTDCAAPTPPAPPNPLNAVAPGNCLNGICIEQSVRTDITNRRVIVGTVPFRVLQMDEPKTYDGYKGRLVYAVTENLTNPGTYDETTGGIAVHDEAGNSLVHMDGGSTDGAGAFVILSHGPTRVGAYNSNGFLMQPCAGASLDVENCNTGFQTGNAASPDSLYIAASQSNTAGVGFFDDFINFFSETAEPRWKYNATDDEGIETIPGNRVGIGTTAPTAELEVRSASAAQNSMRVYGQNGTDGTIKTNQICDNTGTHCFPPALLGGSPGMVCGASQYMVGIENGSAKCAPIAIECPAATPVLTGIHPVTRVPICAAIPLPSCGATTKTVCGPNDIILPSAGNGFVSILYSLGSCKTVQYKCNSGTWSLTTNNGQCTFTAPPPTVVSGISCGPGYTGTYSTTTTATCSGGTATSSTAATDCTCTGGTSSQSATCASLLGAVYVGTATRTVSYSSPSCTPSYSGWNTSGCSCGGPIGTLQWVTNGSCPAGFTGAIKKEQIFDGSSCGWKDTGNVSNTCACNTTPVITSADHVCDDPVCQTPNLADRDIFTANIDPTFCTVLPATQSHVGSCNNMTFKWQEVEDAGTNAASYPADPNFVGSSCSCQDHKDAISGTKKTCFYSSDGSKHIYRCKCL